MDSVEVPHTVRDPVGGRRYKAKWAYSPAHPLAVTLHVAGAPWRQGLDLTFGRDVLALGLHSTIHDPAGDVDAGAVLIYRHSVPANIVVHVRAMVALSLLADFATAAKFAHAVYTAVPEEAVRGLVAEELDRIEGDPTFWTGAA